jgi:hypothetical protein
MSLDEHIIDTDLESYLKDLLGTESAALIDAHLAGCEQCVQRLAEQDQSLWYMAELTSTDQSLLLGEKRGQQRHATNDPALLRVLVPFSNDSWGVRIVNVSMGGLRTYTPKILLPGSLIKVTMQYSVSCGDVRYCEPGESGFYAGVRLHNYFGGLVQKS